MYEHVTCVYEYATAWFTFAADLRPRMGSIS